MRKALSIAEMVMVTISMLLCAWFVISWIDVVSHNLAPNPQYLPWNMFVLLFM